MTPAAVFDQLTVGDTIERRTAAGRISYEVIERVENPFYMRLGEVHGRQVRLVELNEHAGRTGRKSLYSLAELEFYGFSWPEHARDTPAEIIAFPQRAGS